MNGRHDLQSQKGSVLVMVSILSFAMFLVGLSFLWSVHYLRQNIDEHLQGVQSYYDAGASARLYAALARMGQIGYDHTTRWVDYYENNEIRCQIILGGIREIGYEISQGYTVIGFGRSSAYGLEGSREERLTLSFETSTYADYLYLSDRERDPVRHDIISFWTPDTLDGKVHSNDTLHISGSPRFMKKVSFHPAVMDPPYNNATFDEGFTPNARVIFFPDQYQAIRQYNGYPGWGTTHPDSATEITFNGTTIFRRYCGLDTLGNFVCYPLNIASASAFPVPASGALFIEGKVIVKADRGRPDVYDPLFISQGFEGKLTVASSDTMIIPDNLVYKYANMDNSVPTDITDVLGLISENYIMFGEDVDDTLYVNAAMASINGSITVQDIYDYGHSNEKQSLFIYGSLAQRNRGLVHSSYGGGLRGFIEKDYHYDTRLKLHPPPHFLPTGADPEIYYERLYGEEG